MKKIVPIVLATAFSLSAASVPAGNWHVGSSSFCQDCHLQHSSEEGQALAGGPNTYLLLKSSINELCLSCHDGSDPTAPDVLEPVLMYAATSSQESGGGFVHSSGMVNTAGHSLGVVVLTPLQAEGKQVTLTCASCHAVHGNQNFRNLRYDPGGIGDSIVLGEDVDVFTNVKPDTPPTTAGSIAAYSLDNIGYRQGYAQWCSGCHDELRQNSSGVIPAHFRSHPSSIALDAFVTDDHVDIAHWIAGIGEGFYQAGVNPAGIERVPFEVPAAASFEQARLVAGSNVASCQSCHRAHGGESAAGLRWPYREGGERFIAGCQQCHNK